MTEKFREKPFTYATQERYYAKNIVPLVFLFDYAEGIKCRYIRRQRECSDPSGMQKHLMREEVSGP